MKLNIDKLIRHTHHSDQQHIHTQADEYNRQIELVQRHVLYHPGANELRLDKVAEVEVQCGIEKEVYYFFAAVENLVDINVGLGDL